jgi:hypothetical protein
MNIDWMDTTVSHLITMGCGVILGVILTLTVMMLRDIWRDSKKDNNDDW